MNALFETPTWRLAPGPKEHSVLDRRVRSRALVTDRTNAAIDRQLERIGLLDEFASGQTKEAE